MRARARIGLGFEIVFVPQATRALLAVEHEFHGAGLDVFRLKKRAQIHSTEEFFHKIHPTVTSVLTHIEKETIARVLEKMHVCSCPMAVVRNKSLYFRRRDSIG